ncbi:hypothetical protein ElyMa_000075500 [Elysia marginata]|uniref:Uncharacterized protein n=1 Tax=Elysia marginata TaxID=1093978 RepID=A0AAV4EIJ7_9GAST|nr:hypothetical protein ElyMa_000075500 [Elysia marginata]
MPYFHGCLTYVQIAFPRDFSSTCCAWNRTWYLLVRKMVVYLEITTQHYSSQCSVCEILKRHLNFVEAMVIDLRAQNMELRTKIRKEIRKRREARRIVRVLMVTENLEENKRELILHQTTR